MRPIEMTENEDAGEVSVRFKDRLARFGFSTIGKTANPNGTGIIVTEKSGNGKSPEEGVAEDMMSLVVFFSGRFYGPRPRPGKEFSEWLNT